MAAPTVVVWSDYLCPWCYLALDREQQLEALGFEVVMRPWELHPEIPIGGRELREGGRTAAVFDMVGRECAEVGLPFVRPARSPNTRDVLAAAEHVRLTQPEVFPSLHRALFAAHFAEGRDIGNAATVDDIITSCGGDAAPVRAAVDDGTAHEALKASMAEGFEHEVTGTPAFLLPSGFVIPGVQERETMARIAQRMLERADQ
ncbi:MAG TPA: DsbA family protein [Acidimicrobiales bacterium]|nr:DsbA family protein [Acidimicrobiales bacterium]